MTNPLKVSIVTPCRNARPWIRETIASVLGQCAVKSGRVSLEYLVCDGASTDGTVEVVKEFGSPAVKLSSEPDGGMYDALAKGLSAATGDVVAYLNAGDYYHPHALDVVADIFGSMPVSWLTGYNVIYNERGSVTSVALPFRYRRRLFACGAYGSLLPFVQQESTFWRRQLHALVDLPGLARLRYAGDSYLWAAFSRQATLYIAKAVMGGFRLHAGQLSENRNAYAAEVRGFARAPGLLDRLLGGFDRLIWQAPAQVKQLLNGAALLQYDHKTGRWH